MTQLMNLKDRQNRPAGRHLSFFTWKIAVFFLLIGVVLSGMIWRFIQMKDDDLEKYQKLMEISDSDRKEVKAASYKASQARIGVQKDVLYMNGNQRLQLRLHAAGAQLQLDHQGDVLELVEKMQEISCCMQEEFYYLLPDGEEAVLQENGKLLKRHASPDDPASWISMGSSEAKPMQIVRYLTADEGVYHYKSEMFEAQEVSISRFVIPGHALVESIEELKPIMSGIAQKVEFSLNKEKFNFKAYHLKATFFSQSGRIIK